MGEKVNHEYLDIFKFGKTIRNRYQRKPKLNLGAPTDPEIQSKTNKIKKLAKHGVLWFGKPKPNPNPNLTLSEF